MTPASTDYLGLNNLNFLKDLRKNLPKDFTKSANLLTLNDGVLYAWDCGNNCVLTSNVKAVGNENGNRVMHQNLLSPIPVYFQPELLLANSINTLLIVSASSGIIVLELPNRCPPFGAFENNKNLVYCKSHSLDERLLRFSDTVKVRQVRFHPGSPRNNHILALTSDNILRLYSIENSTASVLTTYKIGESPFGNFPGTKTSYLAAFGEVGVDFDFGQPELDIAEKALLNDENKSSAKITWPVYVLRGDRSIYSINIQLDDRFSSTIKGPFPTNIKEEESSVEACSIVCLKSTPEVLCIANSNGTIYHTYVLPMGQEEYEKLKINNSKASKKELICFECIELELGLSTTDDNNSYSCPIFLHKDQSKIGRYFATHTAGIHSVDILCLKKLQSYSNNDNNQNLDEIFDEQSKAEYLICTKTSTSEKTNPVLGFCLYYEPTCLIALLANGKLLTLGILTTEILPEIEIKKESESKEVAASLKQRLLFDEVIERILNKSSKLPILGLNSESKRTAKESYQLLQRVSPVILERIQNSHQAKEVIESRVKALKLMKDYLLKELQGMNNEKHQFREKAENIAEKYEDIKDKQLKVMKKCEKLLVLVSQKRAVLSDAEKNYLEELQKYKGKIEQHKVAIEKLKMKAEYQRMQIVNWKKEEEKTVESLSETHLNTIKQNLKETSDKIQEITKTIRDFKRRLYLK